MLLVLALVLAATTEQPARPDDIQQNAEEIILPDLHGPPAEPVQSPGPLWRLFSRNDSFLEVAFVYVIASPFLNPARILESDQPRAYLYEPVPYWHRSSGFLCFEPE